MNSNDVACLIKLIKIANIMLKDNEMWKVAYKIYREGIKELQ